MQKLVVDVGAFSRIQQRLAEFFHDIDHEMGRNIGDFYTDDGVFLVGDRAYNGREEITRYYAERAQRILREQKDGVRTGRHAFMNLLVSTNVPGQATASYLVIYFSGEGKAPLFGLTTPCVVADCRMDFREDAHGTWRISKFDSSPIFVGDDPFISKAVVKAGDAG